MDLTLEPQPDWELVASGDGRKLERFGRMLIERPAPQAIWPARTDTPWTRAAAIFKRKPDGSGDWERSVHSLDAWNINLSGVSLQLRLTGFGNLGVFPEHTVHWPWLGALLAGRPGAEVLNLFSYTGGASIFCAKSGAKVTHVDSAKSVNAWAALNAEQTGEGLGEIRYIADDALKFVKREIRRGRKYHGIILDPPTFGRGAKGEVWKIERDFAPLLACCASLLRRDSLFLLVTSHSPGVTPAVLRGLISETAGEIESGEMLLASKSGSLCMPAGSFARLTVHSPM